MADKDCPAMLARMDALIDHWYFTDLPTPRAASGAQLEAAWRAATRRQDANARAFASPQQALAAAAAAAAAMDRIVVFGSFYTVGGVLEGAQRSASSV
jgi:dihydrofolate synthase/folylpolyglutamate synthase